MQRETLTEQAATSVRHHFNVPFSLRQKIYRIVSPLRLIVTLLVAVSTISVGMHSLRLSRTAALKQPISTGSPEKAGGSRSVHAAMKSPVVDAAALREDNPVPVTSVPAASYQFGPVAPESIVAAFGTSLATSTVSGTDTDPNTAGIQLPTTLGGTTLKVNGVAAPLFFISPNQINYQLPAGTISGTATIEVTSGNIVSTGTVSVNAVVPAIFSADSSGSGVPAALALRVKANGQQTMESIFSVNSATNRIVARPIDLGPDGESVFLVLFLSGIRRAPDPNNDGNVNEFVRVIINGTELVPAYAGRQGDLVGLDQINVEVPRYLLGAAALDITVVVNGQTFSNRTTAELVAPAISALNWRALGLTNRQIRSFATVGSYLFAATSDGVYCSGDNGVNWRAVNNGIPASTRIFSLLASGTMLYAGTENQGVCISTDNGETWTAINAGLSGQTLTVNNITSYAGRLYAATSGGVCVYNGTSWTALNTGLTNLTTLNLFVDGANLYVGTQAGVFCYNLNGGTTWNAINNGFPVANVQVNSLRSIGGVLFAATNGYGLCRYNGTSWVAVAGGLPSNGIITSIVNDGSRLFISTTLGIYVSNDGGATWTLLNNGLTATDLYTLFVNSGAIFAGTNGGGVFGAPFFNGNRAPIAYSSSVTTNEDVSRRIPLSGYDPDLSPITYTILSNPIKGGLTGTAPNMIYSPNANANGFDSFTFRVSDGTNNSATATVQININPINDAPTATAQSVSTSEDTARAIALTATDVDGDALTYTVVSNPTNGTLSGIVPNLTYTPGANYNGLDSFTFKVSDGRVESAPSTVSITVNAVNDAPVLTVPAPLAASTGDPVSFSVSATDVDAGQIITLSATNVPNGATFNASTGAFSWPSGTVGVYNVSFTATDNGSPALSDTRSVRITVSGNSPNGFWTNGGGTFTGTPSALLADGNDFFVGTASGIYRTSDNGVTFTTVNNGLGTATNIVSLSLVDTTIYAGTQNGLYRSTDKGANWSRVGTNGVQSGIVSVVKLGTTLLASVLASGVYYSTDGNTWTLGFSGINATRGLVVKGSNAYLSTATGVYFSSNGINWEVINNGIGTSNTRIVADLAVRGELLYALDATGLKVTADDGRNWFSVNNSNTIVPTNFNAARLFINGNVVVIFMLSGPVYYSPDGGLNFIQMNTGDTPTGSIAGTLTASTVYSAASSGTGTTRPGLFYSPFPNITTNRAPSITVSGTPSGTTGSAINLTISATDQDSGQTVTLAGVALPSGATFNAATGAFLWTPNTPGTYAVVFSAKDNGSPVLGDFEVVTITVTGAALVGNWSTTANLPGSGNNVFSLATMGTSLFAGSSGGVFKSTDNGATWAAVNTGLATSRSTTSLTVIGANLYAGTSDGLYVSSNEGTSWAKINTGIAGTVQSVAAVGNTLYALTTDTLYVSTSNGANWTGGRFINNAQTVFALGNTLLVGSSNSGLHRSSDGGATWTIGAINQSNSAVFSFAANGATIFAGAADGVYRSTNGGQTWTQLTNGVPVSLPTFRMLASNDLVFAFSRVSNSISLLSVYFSADNGASWRVMDAGTVPSGNINPVLASGNGNLYAGVNNGFAYKSPLPASGSNTAPSLTVPGAQNTTVGQTLNFQVTATDANAGQAVTLSAASLPLGASFVPSTGQFTWTPGVAGTFLVGFTAVDNGTPVLSNSKTVTITVAPPASSPNGFWTTSFSGLETSGGSARALARIGNNVFVGMNNGVWRTSNGGASWTPVNNGMASAVNLRQTFSLSVVGTDLYAGTGDGLYRSTDSGGSWTKINTGLPAIPVNAVAAVGSSLFAAPQGQLIYRSTDNGATWAAVGPSGVPGVEFAVVGSDLYVATGSSTLYRTTNSGGTWTSVSAGLSGTVQTITTIGANLFVGTSLGAFRSSNGGTSWTAINAGLPTNTSVSALAGDGNMLFAGTSSGAYFSTNLGGNWSVMNSGDAPVTVNELTADSSRVYAAATNSGSVFVSPLPAIAGNTAPVLTVPGAQNATTTQALNFTVSATDADSGQTVTLSAAGLPSGATFNASNGQFSWTPNAPATVVVSFTATDSGSPQLNDTKTVTITATGISPSGNWQNISGGLPSTAQTVAVLGTEIFVGTISHGVYKTTNDGQTWVASNAGITNIGVTSLSEVNGNLYAGTNSGLYYSNDGGASWTLINTGLGGFVNNVAQAGTRLLASTNTGVYSSNNSGASWTASATGLPASQQAKSLLVVGAEVFVAAGNTLIVYKSTDNGANWTAVNSGLPASQSVNALAASGASIYAATSAGVYLSTNSGTSWAAAGGGLPTTSNNAQALAISGSNLFVGYFPPTATYASTNGGTSWALMNVGEFVSYTRSMVIKGNKVFAVATPDGFTTRIYVSPVPGT